ncbi:GDP-L-fucose synthase [Candidatus Parcubacteria bacterium]|nr:GDP-L-fucose synthase [Candidatus Parcubacteria bacterium]
MKKDSKIYVAGHNGLVGSSIVRALLANGYVNIVTRSHKDLDLVNQEAVNNFFGEEKPEYVFLAAAKVGGIHANSTYPAEFLYDNLMIESNIIRASHVNGVEKLLFLGSSCIYPKFAEQPIKEESLLTGPLEPTNDAYAIAKIAGIKLCQSYMNQYGSRFISVMPTNLYGPGDNYHPENSHVLPSLIRRFHEAKKNDSKEVIIWGSGNPLREFLFVDDLARACIFLMNNYEEEGHINVGSGKEISIMELAKLVSSTVGYEGSISNDETKPDGTPRKLMDNSKIRSLGWRPEVPLEEGIKIAYKDFIENYT